MEQKGGGIHYILFEVENMDEAARNLAADQVEALQAGLRIRLGTRWALLDMHAFIGFLWELRGGGRLRRHVDPPSLIPTAQLCRSVQWVVSNFRGQKIVRYGLDTGTRSAKSPYL